MSYQIFYNENNERIFEGFVDFPQTNKCDFVDAFEYGLYTLTHNNFNTPFEKILKKRFKCGDCRFIKKHLTMGSCMSYTCQKREHVVSMDMLPCIDFQMNGELKTEIELMERNIDPKTFIDPHPRHKLKNGMEIIL